MAGADVWVRTTLVFAAAAGLAAAVGAIVAMTITRYDALSGPVTTPRALERNTDQRAPAIAFDPDEPHEPDVPR